MVIADRLRALREEKHLPAERSEWVDAQIEVQLDEVKRLSQIVDSLTLLTKADAGLVELEWRPVQFSELVEEAYEDAQVLAQPRGVKVTLGECQGNIITGDRHRLRQLLLILADNATKYNHEGGTVRIALRHIGGFAELRISNTGKGIAPEMIEHAFDRFARGKNVQGEVEGCGLGLTIAQCIVQAHDGTIRLLDDGNGRTVALVRIPAEHVETRSGIRRRAAIVDAAGDVGL